MRRAVLAALVAGLGVAVAGCGDDGCSPEARQEALSRDTDAVLAGVISLNEAYDREAARIAQCET